MTVVKTDGAIVGRILGQIRRRQRPIGALLAGLTVLGLATMFRPESQPTQPVVVAAADIGSGRVITSADVTVRELPTAAVAGIPLVAESEIVGRTTVGPIATSEPITRTRLMAPGLLADINKTRKLPDGLVAAPIRLADSAQARLLKVGDFVDVLAARATAHEGQEANTVAIDVQVLSVPATATEGNGGLLGSSSTVGSSRSDSVIVIAVDKATAIDLAAASTRSQLSVVVKPRT